MGDRGGFRRLAFGQAGAAQDPDCRVDAGLFRLLSRLGLCFEFPDAAGRAAGRLDLLARGLDIFGLGIEAAEEAPAEVVDLAEARVRARGERDFDEADRLRGEIEELGWEVQDVAEGYRLIPKT